MSQKSAQGLVKRRYALKRFLTTIAREGRSVPLEESFLFERYASGELEDIAREILGHESTRHLFYLRTSPQEQQPAGG
jgi:hypothetical protein